MNGAGPQMKHSARLHGRTSSSSWREDGGPNTLSSQWITRSRPGCFADSSRNASRKMMAFSSRLAYTSVMLPRPCRSTALAIDSTGVMPLPPARSRKSPCSAGGVKTPAGGMTSTVSPGPRWSQIQFETCPLRTRLMVTRSASSTCGVLESE